MSNNSGPNIYAARITLRTAATCKTPYAHFDVHVALVQYTLRMLFVDFRCSDLKDSRIVCLHIENIVMIIFQGIHERLNCHVILRLEEN